MQRADARHAGMPLDRLFALYLLLSGAALLFPHHEPRWVFLFAVHIAAAALLWPAFRLDVPAVGADVRRRLRGALDWLPLLLIPVLYTELAPLNRAVYDGRYFDDLIIRVEQALFGGMPSSDWAASLPHLWISEPLHAAYLSYYFIIFVPPLVLFLRGRREAFREGAFALMLAFFVHYLFFIYFPVQGPRYLFPAPGGELANGVIYQLTHRALEAGSAQGAAFPSSHVGVSIAQTLIMWRLLPRLAPVLMVLTVALAAGAVYGGFHYLTDAIAGMLLGMIAVLAARPLYRRLGGITATRAQAARGEAHA